MTDLRVSDVATSLIRTWVPIGVGAFIAWLSQKGDVGVDPQAAATAGTVAAALCAAIYYGLARGLEQISHPSPGARFLRGVGRWMLGGVVRQPVYVQPAEPTDVGPVT